MTLERTLSIIKPDGVKKNIIGEILRRFETNELTVLALRLVSLTKTEAEGFYEVHRERPFFDTLTTFMSSGPIVVTVLEGYNAIQKNRDLMGATDPAEAKEGTIRKDFADNIEVNTVHGSDAPDTAKTEIGYFFPDVDLVGGQRE